MPAYVKERRGTPNDPLKARAHALGLTLVERDWIPSSRRAHECTEYARAEGKLAPFHAAVLEAYWTRGLDLHEWDVLTAAAAVAGLDPAAMRAAVESGAFAAEVTERVAGARELGIHAVPTFVVGDRFLIEGAQTADVFERVLARIADDPAAPR